MCHNQELCSQVFAGTYSLGGFVFMITSLMYILRVTWNKNIPNHTHVQSFKDPPIHPFINNELNSHIYSCIQRIPSDNKSTHLVTFRPWSIILKLLPVCF